MGLLDDAIREHLELKRRRGADPSEVARQQRAALDADHDDSAAIEGDAGQGSGEPVELNSVPVHDGQMLLGDELEPSIEHADGPPEVAASAEPVAEAGVAQETVELDMRRELEKGSEHVPEARASP